jgi:hypothetical protein
LTGAGTYSAGIACNLKSASGVCRTTDASKEKHPFITQDGPDYDPDSGSQNNGIKDAPQQYIGNMRDGSSAGYKYFDIEAVSEISVMVRGNAEGEIGCFFTQKGKHAVETGVSIPVSSAEDWRKLQAGVSVPEGIYELSFKYKGTGAVDFKSFTLAYF